MTTTTGKSSASAIEPFDHRAGDFLFFSPHTRFRARGPLRRIEAPTGPELPTAVAGALGAAHDAGAPNPIVVGALPFRPDRPSAIYCADTVCPVLEPDIDASPGAGGSVIGHTPDGPGYRAGVRRALAMIEGGVVDKVVLSRAVDVDCAADVPSVVARLAARDPHAYVFATELPAPDETPATLVGASPELLVARHGATVTSHPLAGSLPRSSDSREDRRRAEALLASSKDTTEHAFVVDAIAATLRPRCRALSVPATPQLTRTAAMWHLGTPIVGELDDTSIGSLELALALHPTPAVCGSPRNAALAAIDSIEPYDRGFYTGLVGWSDGSGDGEWAVTIRCAVLGESTARLYAGAGIVAASDPDAELAETTAKLATIRTALGITDPT